MFGFFCRRNFLGFTKLSFSGIMKLQEDFNLWWNGIDLHAGYQRVPKDEMNNGRNRYLNLGYLSCLYFSESSNFEDQR